MNIDKTARFLYVDPVVFKYVFSKLTYLFLVKQFRLGPIFKHDIKSIYEEISLNQIKSKYVKGKSQNYKHRHLYNDRVYLNDNYV